MRRRVGGSMTNFGTDASFAFEQTDGNLHPIDRTVTWVRRSGRRPGCRVTWAASYVAERHSQRSLYATTMPPEPTGAILCLRGQGRAASLKAPLGGDSRAPLHCARHFRVSPRQCRRGLTREAHCSSQEHTYYLSA